MEEKRILAIQFGFDCLQMARDCLKDEQRKAILKVLEGNRCFISLPTGYGKSLIFQVLPFVIEYYRRYEDSPPISINDCSSIVLVISPLLALMEEQCKALNEKCVAAANVGTNSDITTSNFNILYFSPECLLGVKKWQNLLLSSFAEKLLLLPLMKFIVYWKYHFPTLVNCLIPFFSWV